MAARHKNLVPVLEVLELEELVSEVLVLEVRVLEELVMNCNSRFPCNHMFLSFR